MPNSPHTPGISGSANSAFIVQGEVRHADGSSYVGASASAFDRDLRSEEKLWQAVTDHVGRYEIRYTAKQFRREEKGTATAAMRHHRGFGAGLLGARPIRDRLSGALQST